MSEKCHLLGKFIAVYFIVMDTKDTISKLVLNRVIKQTETSCKGLAAIPQNPFYQWAWDLGKWTAHLQDKPNTHLLQVLSWGMSVPHCPHAPKSSTWLPSHQHVLPHWRETGSCARAPVFSPFFIQFHSCLPVLMPTVLSLNRWRVFSCWSVWCPVLRVLSSVWEGQALCFTP